MPHNFSLEIDCTALVYPFFVNHLAVLVIGFKYNREQRLTLRLQMTFHFVPKLKCIKIRDWTIILCYTYVAYKYPEFNPSIIRLFFLKFSQLKFFVSNKAVLRSLATSLSSMVCYVRRIEFSIRLH